MQHNFTDGMALGSAFLLYGSVGGWSRTLFLLAHELPQEVRLFLPFCIFLSNEVVLYFYPFQLLKAWTLWSLTFGRSKNATYFFLNKISEYYGIQIEVVSTSGVYICLYLSVNWTSLCGILIYFNFFSWLKCIFCADWWFWNSGKVWFQCLKSTLLQLPLSIGGTSRNCIG